MAQADGWAHAAPDKIQSKTRGEDTPGKTKDQDVAAGAAARAVAGDRVKDAGAGAAVNGITQ